MLPVPFCFAGQRHSPLSQCHSPAQQRRSPAPQCPSPAPPGRSPAPQCQSPALQRRSPGPPQPVAGPAASLASPRSLPVPCPAAPVPGPPIQPVARPATPVPSPAILPVPGLGVTAPAARREDGAGLRQTLQPPHQSRFPGSSQLLGGEQRGPVPAEPLALAPARSLDASQAPALRRGVPGGHGVPAERPRALRGARALREAIVG